jgi:hypothetical protein
MKIEAEQEKEKPCGTHRALVKDFIAARNVTFSVNDVMKIGEEKFSSVSKGSPMHAREEK